jgi:hypothetical protein
LPPLFCSQHPSCNSKRHQSRHLCHNMNIMHSATV